MATLTELLSEQARIKAELQRMENDETVTEEDDGDLRDTLIRRWEDLDSRAKPLIERMEQIRDITRAAADTASTEDGADPGAGGGARPAAAGIVSRYGGGSPDLVVTRHRDPYDNNEAVRSGVIRRSELRERAFDAIEREVKRGNLIDDFAEVVTRRVQDGGILPTNNIARHILLTGGEEYQEAFRAYLADPQGEAQRAALSLSLANGGYLLPFVLDQLQVA
jgi:hypothetical protein